MVAARLEKHYKYHFVSYGQAYDDLDPKQISMQELLSWNATCLGPTENMWGSYYFLDLDTKAIIKCQSFTEFPIPDSMIKKMEH